MRFIQVGHIVGPANGTSRQVPIKGAKTVPTVVTWQLIDMKSIYPQGTLQNRQLMYPLCTFLPITLMRITTVQFREGRPKCGGVRAVENCDTLNYLPPAQ